MDESRPRTAAPAGSPGDPVTIYTIGHSTRTLDEFLALLGREGIRHVADVRAFPSSRRHPHFNGPALAEALAALGIGYSHHPALGGRRRPRPDSPNDAWRNEGFRGYADHMASEEFQRAVEALLTHASSTPTALLCAEAVPWRCHRSLLADALVVRGVRVSHILDARTDPHRLTPFAVVRGHGITYPAAERSAGSQGDLFA